jgi:hypothetical protein
VRFPTPPDRAQAAGTLKWCFTCITQLQQPEQCCRLQLLHWPDIGGYHTERK